MNIPGTVTAHYFLSTRSGYPQIIRKFRNIILFIVITGFCISNSLHSQGFDNQTRAIYILDISKYVEYPPDFDKNEFFRIGIIDQEDSLYWEIDHIARTRKYIQGKPIRLFYFRDPGEIKPTEVIYFNKSSNIRIPAVLSKITGNHTLLITEGYEFRESMLNFVVINDKPEFEVNQDLLSKEGLKVNQLFLAQAIKSREDWQKLFEKTDEELQEEKVITRQQKELIEEQATRINEQAAQILLQQNRLDSLNLEILERQEDIKRKELILGQQLKEISGQKDLINRQLEKVNQQKRVLEDLESSIKTKESEILKQNEQISNQKSLIFEQVKQIEKQKLISIFILIALGLVTGLGYFIYINYRNKKKANDLLEIKNKLITKQKDEIQVQKELAESQRDQITYQKKHITDSIHYALRIQNALLPSLELFTDEIEHFVVYKPRDIVSGDFYWVHKAENRWIVIAADCTGHGVPGAFMSMLGKSLLNEIVINHKITRPDLILNELRINIINSLRQKEGQGSVKDGMDISVCAIDYANKVLEWSGANNPLFLIQKGELFTFKADKMPVAIHDVMEPFALQSFKLNPGDTFYIFSDGFIDQFGGSNQKKFLIKNFKDVLLSIQKLSMYEQGKKLDEIFENWRKELEQVDDVTVIGIKFQ